MLNWDPNAIRQLENLQASEVIDASLDYGAVVVELFDEAINDLDLVEAANQQQQQQQQQQQLQQLPNDN